MVKTRQETHQHMESDEIRAMSASDGQTTTCVYRNERSMFGVENIHEMGVHKVRD